MPGAVHTRYRTEDTDLAFRKNDAAYPELWNGLVAAYSPELDPILNDLLIDRSGNGADMALSSTNFKIGVSQGRRCIIGNHTDYGYCDLPMASNQMTIAGWLWAQKNSSTASNPYTGVEILAEGSDNFNNTDAAWIAVPSDYSSTDINASMQDGSAGSPQYYQVIFNNPTNFANQQWHHFIFLFDGSTAPGVAGLTLDGAARAPTSVPFTSRNQTNNFRTDCYWFGRGDNDQIRQNVPAYGLRVWDRLLSWRERRLLYNFDIHEPLRRDYFAGFVPVATAAGTASITVSGMTIAASGLADLTSNASIDMVGIDLSASGSQESITSTGTVDLVDLDIIASGTEEFTSTASVDLVNMDLTASGLANLTSNASIDVTDFDITASGTQSNDITSTASIDLVSLDLSVSGTEEFSSVATVDLSAFDFLSSGTQEYLGTAAISLINVDIASSGVQEYTSTAAVDIAGMDLTSSGLADLVGSATVDVSAMTVTSSATSVDSISSTVSITLQSFDVSTEGSFGIDGSCVITLVSFDLLLSGGDLSAITESWADSSYGTPDSWSNVTYGTSDSWSDETYGTPDTWSDKLVE